MNNISDLIQRYGDLAYLITFLWTALEGETFVIFAGLAAQKGMLNVWGLFFAAWSGSFVGDQIFFMIGRMYGVRLLKHLPKIKPAVDRSLGWLEQHAVLFIIAYRFMYGVRNISGLAIGMSHIPFRQFASWNALASFIWAASFVGFGYLFGDIVSRMSDKTDVLENTLHQVTFSVLGLFLIMMCLRFLVVRYQNKRKPPQ